MKPSNWTWTKYIRAGVGRRLSLLGSKWGLPWLTYNPLHFYSFHENAVRSAGGVISTFLRVFPQAHRYLDVGAGSGAFAAEAQRRGLQVVAIEYNSYGRRLASKQAVDTRLFDLNLDPPAQLEGNFDLAYCLEVAEHLPPALGDRLVEYLAKIAPIVIFTAAHPGQGGTGHINEQPQAYWIARFESSGMGYSTALSRSVAEGLKAEGVLAKWLWENAMCFTRTDGRLGQSPQNSEKST